MVHHTDPLLFSASPTRPHELGAGGHAKFRALFQANEAAEKVFRVNDFSLVFTNVRILKLNIDGGSRQFSSIPFRAIDSFSQERIGPVGSGTRLSVRMKGHDRTHVWEFSTRSDADEACRILTDFCKNS